MLPALCLIARVRCTLDVSIVCSLWIDIGCRLCSLVYPMLESSWTDDVASYLSMSNYPLVKRDLGDNFQHQKSHSISFRGREALVIEFLYEFLV